MLYRFIYIIISHIKDQQAQGVLMDAATASAPPPRLLQYLVPGIWCDYPVQATYGGSSKIRWIATYISGRISRFTLKAPQGGRYHEERRRKYVQESSLQFALLALEIYFRGKTKLPHAILSCIVQGGDDSRGSHQLKPGTHVRTAGRSADATLPLD